MSYGKSIVTPRQLEVCLENLYKTYSEAGGKKFSELEENVEGLSPFDAIKVVLVKKLDKIREVFENYKTGNQKKRREIRKK
jgi:hypothetical protein